MISVSVSLLGTNGVVIEPAFQETPQIFCLLDIDSTQ
jgi:hypothetical protein